MGKHRKIERLPAFARAVVVAGAVGFLGGGASACNDSSVEPQAAASDASETSDIVAGLTGEAGVESSGIPEIREIIERYEGRLNEPGITWYLAADLQAVLTGDQIAAIAGVQGEPGRRVRQKGEREDRGFGPDHGEDLDLTEEQRSQMKAIREQFGPELRRLREAVSSGELDREEAREQMDAIRDAIRTEVQAILTDEQKARIQTRNGDRVARGDVRDEARAAERDAMHDALGMSAEQISALEASPEGRRTAFESILTQTQKEIIVLHGALTSRLRVRRSGEDGDRPFRPGRRGPG